MNYRAENQVDTSVYYCPYIPLQYTSTVTYKIEMPPKIDQMDEEVFILRRHAGGDLTEKQIYAIDWVKENVPKGARIFEADMEDNTYLIKIKLSEKYAVLFKMFVM